MCLTNNSTSDELKQFDNTHNCLLQCSVQNAIRIRNTNNEPSITKQDNTVK